MSTARTKDRKTTNPAQKAIEPQDELVTCFISGQVVAKTAASLVKLGPGQRVWMAHELIADRELAKRS